MIPTFNILNKTLAVDLRGGSSFDFPSVFDSFLVDSVSADFTISIDVRLGSASDISHDWGWIELQNGLIQASEKPWVVRLDKENPAKLCTVFTTKEAYGQAIIGALSLYYRYNLGILNGSFFHGAGIQVFDRAFIFLATSGTGKTTLARQASQYGFPILSDEIVYIEYRENEIIAHGTPFSKISDGPIMSPVSAFFFLKQSASTELIQIGTIEAVARAWSDSLYNTPYFSNEQRALCFDKWFELFRAYPCFELGIPLNFHDWEQLIQVVDRV